MTDLDRLREAAIPRGSEVANHFARKVEPLVGFLTYAALYLFWGVWIFLMVGGGIGLGIASLAGLENDGDASNAVVLAFAAIGFAVSWWPFVRWAKEKRLRAMSFIEKGALVDGKVATTTGDRFVQAAARMGGSGLGGMRWHRVVFEADGNKYFTLCPFKVRPAEGTSATVLFQRDYKYAFGFDPSGRAVLGKLHRG